ncbi:kinase-like protein [Aspergillus insuetus]
MNTIKPLVPRFSALLRKTPFSLPSPGPLVLPGILVDEESSPVCNSKSFYPAKPGEILGDLWLARDLQGHIDEPEHVVALKIANANTSSASHEREVEEHISAPEPSHRGRLVIRTLIDSFEIEGFERRFDNKRMPLPITKTYIRAFLTGLEYLHRECRVVHTDLKLDNIMVTLEDPAVLGDFMDTQLEKPMAFKVGPAGRPVYQSRNDFGQLRRLRSIPQLVDFGLATRLEEADDWGVWPIQPDHYRAPEVIMGHGWQMPADIWNIGSSGKELFQHIHDEQGRYDAKLHLAEMIALLGPPSPEIIQRYQCMREYSWPEPVRREDGRVCETAEESLSLRILIPNRRLGDTVSFLEGEEREAFLDLAKGMLVWRPDCRKTAGELARHPFLQLKQTSA